MDDLCFSRLPERAPIHLARRAMPGDDEMALIDHLTPAGHRAVLLLLLLSFIDFAVHNIPVTRTVDSPMEARHVAVAAAPVVPTFRVGPMMIREMPSPTPLAQLQSPLAMALGAAPQTPAPAAQAGPTAPQSVVASATTPAAAPPVPVTAFEAPAKVVFTATSQAPAPTRLADLETPGEVALGADPIPEARVADDSTDAVTPIVPANPKPYHHQRHKLLAASVQPVPAAVQPAAPKPAATDFLSAPPSFWAMTGMLENKASRPQPIFND